MQTILLFITTAILGMLVGFIFTIFIYARFVVGDLSCVMLDGEPEYLVIFNDEESKQKVPTLQYVMLRVTKSQNTHAL